MFEDLILNEAQKLALVLAKMLGLKEHGKHSEFVQLAENTALKEYDIAWDELLDMPLVDFEAWLLNEGLSTDKLDALAQLLYLQAEPLVANAQTFLSLQKILHTYNRLEREHRWQSLENINRRKLIEQFMGDSL